MTVKIFAFAVTIFIAGGLLAIEASPVRSSEVSGDENTEAGAIVAQKWTTSDVKWSTNQQRWLETPSVIRAGFSFPRRLWPGGVVPYVMDESITGSTIANQVQTDWFHQGRSMIENSTCVRFVPRSQNQSDYVRIGRWVQPCQSELGKREAGGEQYLNLGLGNIGCDNGTVAHELMHTLGVLHEHQRYDRDDYIDIDWKALDRVSQEQNFNWHGDYEKDGSAITDTYGQPYAYDSIMHYQRWAPGTHGKPPQVIHPKMADDPRAKLMGQTNYLTQEDIGLINAMYCRQ